MTHRFAVAAALLAALTVSLSGCSTPSQKSSTGTTPQATAASSGPATTSSTASAPEGPGRHGTANGLSITVAPQAGTTVKPGGPPLSFTVALLNTTPADIAEVGLVVSLGHCGCGSPEQHMMPFGSLRMLDPNTNNWVAAPYNREAGGMDFIEQTLVPPFGIKAGQSISYQLELALDAQQEFPVGKGDGAINVTRTDVSTHNAIGPTPAASLRISVEPQ